MSIAIEDIVDVRDYLHIRGLNCPALEALNPTEQSYRALLLQPAGPIIANETRIGPYDLSHADAQATKFLERAANEGHHLVVTPEYYLPVATLLKCVSGSAFPSPDAIWVLGCESMTPSQVCDFKEKAHATGKCDVFFEEDAAAAVQGTYYDPVAYCFVAKDNQGNERRVVILQFKTISSKDDYYFENKHLRVGKQIYRFTGQDGLLSLATIICSDAFSLNDNKAVLQRLTHSATLLHVQLNPKPRHPDYRKYRVDTFARNHHTSNCDIVCLNWAENISQHSAEGDAGAAWNNENGSAWYIPDDRCSSRDVEVDLNERRGLYYSKHVRHRHVLNFHYGAAAFALTVPKLAHYGLHLHDNPLGPVVDRRYTWSDDAKDWVEDTTCPDTGLTKLFTCDAGVIEAFATLKDVESRLQIERAIALSCGITTGKENWFGAHELAACRIGDDELLRRVTVRLERDKSIEESRYQQVQSVAMLRDILAKATPAMLPKQISDLAGGDVKILWTLESPHTNVMKDGVQPALVAFLGLQPSPDRIKGVSLAAYELLRREGKKERSHRLAVCYLTPAGTKFAPIPQLTDITHGGGSATSIDEAD